MQLRRSAAPPRGSCRVQTRTRACCVLMAPCDAHAGISHNTRHRRYVWRRCLQKRVAAAGAGSRTLSVLCFRQHSPQQKQAAASLCGVGVRRRQQRIQKQARQECMVSTSQPGQPRKLRQLPRSRSLRRAKSKGGGATARRALLAAHCVRCVCIRVWCAACVCRAAAAVRR